MHTKHCARNSAYKIERFPTSKECLWTEKKKADMKIMNHKAIKVSDNYYN